MQTTVGAITLGQAPRDDIVPAMQARLGPQTRFVQAGALDEVPTSEIESMVAESGERAHVSRLRDGSSTKMLSHAKWAPLMQSALDRVVADGAEVVIVLCASDWSELRSDVLMLNAGPMCDGVVNQLAAGKRLGVIRPRPDSPDEAQDRKTLFDQFGIEPSTTVLNPYAAGISTEDFARAGEDLRRAGADSVFLACMGMDTAMRDAVRSTSGCPVFNAQGIMVSILREIIQGQPLTRPLVATT